MFGYRAESRFRSGAIVRQKEHVPAVHLSAPLLTGDYRNTLLPVQDIDRRTNSIKSVENIHACREGACIRLQHFLSTNRVKAVFKIIFSNQIA